MLAEALNQAFEIARELGIEIGGKDIVDSNIDAAKSKPKGVREKIKSYDLILSTGSRLKKSEILKRI